MAYRVKQFACALITRMRPQERAEIEGLLTPEETALFFGMTRPAIRHGLRVFRHLRWSGSNDRELLAAALLHDIGKGQVGLAHRVAVVLLEAACPALLLRIGSKNDPRWRRGFHRHCLHPELGAELARQAGSQSRVVELIRYHHASVQNGPPGLAVLRMADEGS